MAVEYRAPNFDLVEKFLVDNQVCNGWRELILGDNEVKHCLWQIISELELQSKSTYWRYAPRANQILRAFALCKPDCIKLVIIGTAPITGEGVANGLAFSSNATEDEFTEKQAIFKVHKVLKEVGILDKQYDYRCGHEEWARNGVLLLNAALTISLNDDSSDNIRKHCRKWKPFLAGLLNTWINNIRPEQTIFVMLWGYEDRADVESENYAKELWNGINNVSYNFKVREAHHPTFPRDKYLNNFIQKVASHFREIVDGDVEFMKVFAISDRYLHNVNMFLNENAVKDGWKRLILNNNDLQVSLGNIIDVLHLTDGNVNNRLAPHKGQILRAFKFCDPKDIKVVIIGASLCTVYHKANGLAFSADVEDNESNLQSPRDVLKVHLALKDAGILNDRCNYYCGHEEWAEKGVLLLNAALTMETDDWSAMILKKHCEIWRPFLVKLLETWIEETILQQNIFVMLWGYECALGDLHADNYARKIWNEVNLVPGNFVIRDAHHPTFPRSGNNFLEMATRHFEEIAHQYNHVFKTTLAMQGWPY